MRVTILDDYQDAVRTLTCFEKLAGHEVTIERGEKIGGDRPGLARALEDAEALVLIRERTRVDEALLAMAPKLRLISQTGRISGHIDLPACTRRKVAVAEGGGSPYAPAELTWALILAASRQLGNAICDLKVAGWQSGVLGRTVRGRTLGIYGYGKIGSLVAGYGKAFGMNVIAWGREGSLKRARADGYAVAASREALFAESDVLSLHLRLTPETRGSITLEDICRMKPDALLVNTSRAELLPPGVLYDALMHHWPGYAAVDVYEREPVLPLEEPLVEHPRVLCTPHLGYVERDSYELYFGAAFDNLNAFAKGAPKALVNPEALGG